jgi:hypothetical protein
LIEAATGGVTGRVHVILRGCTEVALDAIAQVLVDRWLIGHVFTPCQNQFPA